MRRESPIRIQRIIFSMLACVFCASVLALPASARPIRHETPCGGYATAYGRARCIVYAVFPASTAPAALRVVGCESNFDPSAYNPSGATGLFQVLQGNAGRVLFYAGRRLVIDGRRLWNPWYNAQVALYLSHGGTNWSEWSCRWAIDR